MYLKSFAYAVLIISGINSKVHSAIGASINEAQVERTYYVKASGGNDGASGTSETTAFASIPKALSMANTDGQHSKIIIYPGTYTISSQQGLGPKNEILVFEGTQKGSVIIETKVGNNGFYAENKHNVVWRKLSFKNGTGANVIFLGREWQPFSDNANWLFEDCEFTDNANNGLRLDGLRNLTVKRTTFHRNGYWAAFLLIWDSEFEDCVFSENHHKGTRAGTDWTSAVAIAADNVRWTNCKWLNNTFGGIQYDHVGVKQEFIGCEFINNNGPGLKAEIALGPITISNSVFERNKYAIALETVWNVSIDRCLFRNNVEDVIRLTWKKRDGLLGVNDIQYNWGNGGPGNMRVPIGSNWIYQSKMTGTLQTSIRNSIFIGTGSGVFIKKRNVDTDPMDYERWYRDELTTDSNVYWHPTNSNVFQLKGDWQGGPYTDLIGWRNATGGDSHSKWSSDTAFIMQACADSERPGLLTSLIVSDITKTSAKLNWTGVTAGVTTLRISRGVETNPRTWVVDLPANTNSWTDSGLTPGVSYTWAIETRKQSCGSTSEKIVSGKLLDPNKGDVIAAINVGGASYKAASGVEYTADWGYVGGNSYLNTGDRALTNDGVLYESERYGNFQYRIPAPTSGYYSVLLQMSEGYHSLAGERVFDVKIEDQFVLNSLDLVATKGKMTAVDTNFTVEVIDGMLNIEFISKVESAILNAMIISFEGATGPVSLKPAISMQGLPTGHQIKLDPISGKVFIQKSGKTFLLNGTVQERLK
jgi:hypothetical protein